ncbi:MAG: hypothetical protein V1774_11550 [Candidatus Eisenbacteria bacterium]
MQTHVREDQEYTRPRLEPAAAFRSPTDKTDGWNLVCADCTGIM